MNSLYNGNKQIQSQYSITQDQAFELLIKVAKTTYIPNLNSAIQAFNDKEGSITEYSQQQLEAMFDYSYNNGLSSTMGLSYSVNIDDPSYVIFYYLRKDQKNAVEAVKKYGTDNNRRRLNQMYLFFKERYDFEEDLNLLKISLGF